MKYVLIWVFLTMHGPSTGSAEFDDADSCINALHQTYNAFRAASDLKQKYFKQQFQARCVRKGS